MEKKKRLHAPNVGDTGFIPGWGIKIPHAVQSKNPESPGQTGMSAPLAPAPLVPASPMCLAHHATQALFFYVYNIKAGWEAVSSSVKQG